MRLQGREVCFLLKRSKRRSRIEFTVDERGLAVHAPWASSERRIESAISHASGWILKTLDTWSQQELRVQHWRNGAELSFLGRLLTLEVVADAILVAPVLVEPALLRITVADPGTQTRVREAVLSWYRGQAARNYAQRIALYCPLLGVAAPRLVLSNARTQWGSCNFKSEVRLNWRLIQASQPLIDYVVVHELAHMIEMNHSKHFWRIVNRAFPGHRAARAELERRGRWYMEI
ncbi:MAG: M48 family metallopeptidase [Burkholderiales bacterium]